MKCPHCNIKFKEKFAIRIENRDDFLYKDGFLYYATICPNCNKKIKEKLYKKGGINGAGTI